MHGVGDDGNLYAQDALQSDEAAQFPVPTVRNGADQLLPILMELDLSY